MPSASRSGVRGSESWRRRPDREAAAQAEVQGARLHPVPPLWPAARRVPQVRAVPRVPARARRTRARSPASRRPAGEGRRPMTMTDPIADMLTRIRNANVAMHDEVRMPSLQAEGGPRRGRSSKEGYIEGFSVEPTTPSGRASVLHHRHEVLARAERARSPASSGLQARPAGLPQGRRGPAGPRRARCRRPVHQPGAHDRP